MAVIAIDLGGTKLAGAIFRGDGTILHSTISRLEGRQGRAVGELVGSEIANLLDLARSRRVRVRAIGVAVPGIVDSKAGTVWAPNIGGWEKYPLHREIELAIGSQKPLGSRSRLAGLAATPLRVVIESDRACYVLGEAWRGVARGCRNAIFLAVGTGIGAGILVDGRVLRGAHGIAGAAGWLALDRPFRREYVQCGCFEYHASGAGLAKVALALLRNRPHPSVTPSLRFPTTARDVFSGHERGDPVAKKVLAEAIQFWAMAVANLVSLFDPEMIVFGGGVFGPGKRFLAEIRAEARKWAQPISFKNVKLRISQLGPNAGLYGTGYLALQASRTVLAEDGEGVAEATRRDAELDADPSQGLSLEEFGGHVRQRRSRRG